MARQALGAMRGGGMPEKIHYELKGKLNGSAFSAVRFQNQGDLELPTAGVGGT